MRSRTGISSTLDLMCRTQISTDRMHRLAQILLFLVLCVALAGCGGGRTTEAELKEVLEKDPQFEKVLDARTRIKIKISDLQEQYKQEVGPLIRSLESKIISLKTEYGLKKSQLKSAYPRMESIKKLLNKKESLALTSEEISIWNKRHIDLEKEIDSLRKELDNMRERRRLLKTEIRILREE